MRGFGRGERESHCPPAATTEMTARTRLSVCNKKPLKNMTFGEFYYLGFFLKGKHGQLREVEKKKGILKKGQDLFISEFLWWLTF